ncbi:efflux RND transporter permease subunit [Pseudoalteromonas xiamenensis]|uniref:efflux RND transporter permease subunit n=1 Tax=Pseudoalteromonas xiamenensis TaxID=882626 RepID=UPI003CC719F4
MVFLGIAATFKLPYSLLPEVVRPQIALVTDWPGKSSAEIEQALIAPMERQLSLIRYVKRLSKQCHYRSSLDDFEFSS